MTRVSTRPAPAAKPPREWPAEITFRPWKARLVQVGAPAVAAVALLAFGVWLGRATGGGASSPPAGAAAPQASWTCSMHPQIQLPRMGLCPICNMDLVPVSGSAADDTGRPRLTLSERARTLARVETVPVARRLLTHTLRLFGKIAPDETTVMYVNSPLPGRVVQLHARATGLFVQPQEPLAEIFSPDLLTKQREFILAQDALDRAEKLTPDPRPRNERAVTTLEAPRRSLLLWGLREEEIDLLAEKRICTDRLTVRAPDTGWVLERPCYEGLYVEPGTSLFTLVDLRRVWVLLDAYELDLPYLRYGQSVELEAEALPGRTFTGRIALLEPQLQERSRTVKVRVCVDNEGLQLRPGMFVHGRLTVKVGEGGAIVEDSLAGKWLSPLYPEVVTDAPGTCPHSSLTLVSAESLGYATTTVAEERALAVPAGAVLVTGRRALVYVEQAGEDGASTYEGRVVELGPRAGDDYVVLGGVSEGERVVARGALQIDSALQIQARPCMMDALATDASRSAGTQPPAERTRALPGAGYHAAMHAVIDRYLAFTAALVAADAAAAVRAAGELRQAAQGAEPQGLAGDDAELFRNQVQAIAAAAPSSAVQELEPLRAALPALTKALNEYLAEFGHDRPQPLVRIRCPMAFDNRGGEWFHTDETVSNPYFGSQMLRCGKRQTAIAANGHEVQ